MVYELFLFLILLGAGFYIILKAADYFIDEAAAIGYKLGMSKMIIGLTIVAIGTSLPELFTSIVSIMFTPNYPDFIIGTIMGSNITNILLIFGLFMVMAKKFEIHKNERLNVIMLLFTSIFFTTFVLLGFVNYFVILLVILYMVYTIYLAKFEKKELIEEEEAIIDHEHKPMYQSVLILLLSFVGLFAGTKMVIYSIEGLGALLLIPTAYLTLTTVAFATSLPEIAVTIIAAKKKQYMMCIGNLIGSNIANVAIIFGISGFFGFYYVETQLFKLSIAFMLIATFYISFLVSNKKFAPVHGYIFLLGYIAYIITFFF